MGGLMTSERSTAWLTSRRLRSHGLILAVCLWSVYLWNMSAPGLRDRAENLKGTDFLHFYTLGSLALAHRGADLYNAHVQSEIAAARVPAAIGIEYLPLYPPQVSIFFAPFAKASYAVALAAWLALSSLIYGFCCYVVCGDCPNLRKQKVTVLILGLAFPAFWHLIAWGQTSALALACFTLAYCAFRSDRQFLAGLALGCLIFKPQLALASAIVYLVALQWRVVVGAALSSIVQLSLGWLYYGSVPLRQWLRAVIATPNELGLLEPRIYQTHCLRTFWSMLIPWNAASLALFFISAIAIATFGVAIWRSRLPLALRFSALLFAAVLLAPHLTVYDLVILAPAFLLTSDWIVSQPAQATISFKLLLYSAFIVPLLGPLARWTHLQLSVPIMAMLVVVIWKQSRELPFTTAHA
jgi:Glycosyltransferase family 87